MSNRRRRGFDSVSEGFLLGNAIEGLWCGDVSEKCLFQMSVPGERTDVSSPAKAAALDSPTEFTTHAGGTVFLTTSSGSCRTTVRADVF